MRTPPRLLVLLPLLAGVLLAGCAQPADVGAPVSTTDPDTTTESPTTEPTSSEPTTSATAAGDPTAADLTITVQAGPDAEPQTSTLTCEPAGGSYPDPAAGCEFLSTVEEDVFAPVGANVACTEIYGGPQTATISGTLRGNQIDAAFSRVNGCEIGRWDAMEPLLGPGGV